MILIFAGAGASYAIDKKQYPTTKEFLERLPNHITSNPLFSVFQNFCKKAGQEDIEYLLWRLEEFIELCEKSTNTDEIEGYALHRSTGITQFPVHVHEGQLSLPDTITSPFLQFLHFAGSNLQELADGIKQQVHAFYSVEPQRGQLAPWMHLLAECLKIDSHVEIFTVNYDVVIESVLKNLNKDHWKNNLGWEDSSSGTVLDFRYWDEGSRYYSLNTKDVLLTKLHGSVNWSRNNEKIHIGNPQFTGNLNNHALIYPGSKGWPDEQPFESFYNHLGRASDLATIAIFIGYAFRDEEIGILLSECANSEKVLKIIITDLKGTDEATEYPKMIEDQFAEPYSLISNGFSSGSAKAFIKKFHEWFDDRE